MHGFGKAIGIACVAALSMWLLADLLSAGGAGCAITVITLAAIAAIADRQLMKIDT